MNGEASKPALIDEASQPGANNGELLVADKPSNQADSLNASIIKALSDPSNQESWFNHILNRLDKSRILGSGGFATVYEVDISELIADKPLLHNVACKKLQMNAVNDFVRRQFHSEVASMQRMNDPHIVRVLGARCTKDCSLIVMELMKGGSIAEAVADHAEQDQSGEGIVRPTYSQRFAWVQQLLHGVAALHDAKIAHRDLKAANLLLNEDRTVLKIGDFGLAKIKDQTMSVATHKGEASIAFGTRRHMSPELFDPKIRKPDLFAADMYAVGGCIEHILTGEMPHAHLREDVVFECARRSPQELVHAELPQDCPNRAHWESLIALCRSVRPAARPTVVQAVEIVAKFIANDVEGIPVVDRVDDVLSAQVKRLALSELALQQKEKEKAEQVMLEAQAKLAQRALELAAEKQRVEEARVVQEKARLELQKRAEALAAQHEKEKQRQALTRARERALQAELDRLEAERQEMAAAAARQRRVQEEAEATRVAQLAREAEARRQQESRQRQIVSHSYGGYVPSPSPSPSYVTPPRAHGGVATGEYYRSNGSADGRAIYQGPKGGLYTITPSGNKSYIRNR